MKQWIFFFLALLISGPGSSYELGPDGKAAQALLENIAAGPITNILMDLNTKLVAREAWITGLEQVKAGLKNARANESIIPKTAPSSEQ